jgi:tetratricopeptide (TPR) repeat protein
MKHFTAREVAKVLDVSEAQVKLYLRMVPVSAPLGPDGELELSFQDVLLLKTTHALAQSGVPASRIRRSWSSLQSQAEGGLPLTSIRLVAEGKRVVASDGRRRWRPDSGQFVMAFESIESAETQAIGSAFDSHGAALALTERETAIGEPTADDWYRRATELESESSEEARFAYEEALKLDPTLADAHINLGRLAQEAGNLGKAEAHYRDAVRHAPSDATAHFNLGVLLEERGNREDAVHAYRQAIARDSDMADAHYNLGLLLESLGRRPDAMAHLMTARELYHRLTDG